MVTLSISSPGYSAGVEQLQNNLLALGFFCVLDGYFGPETQQAVRDFQYTWGGLTVDGIVGPMTAAAIDSAVNLLLKDQWNASADPMEAPATILPTTVVAKILTSTGTKKTTQVSSVLKAIGWVGIAIPIGIIVYIIAFQPRGYAKT